VGLHLGMIGDMLNRHRIYLEELLFHQRKEDSSVDRVGSGPGQPQYLSDLEEVDEAVGGGGAEGHR
jgi:hypothetical protein